MRPIPDASYFRLIRDAYCKAKLHSHDPHDQSFFSSSHNDDDTSFFSMEEKEFHGPYVQFEIRRSSLVGDGERGVFVTEFVAKGQPVWGCELYGIFRCEQEWNDFLNALLEQQQQHGTTTMLLLEDAILWSYVMNWGDGTYVVGIDLDEASLMNHGGPTLVMHNHSPCDNHIKNNDDDDNQQCDLCIANIACEYRDGQWNYYATRDIYPNEEILCDYNQFHVADHPLDWYTKSIQKITSTNK